jgi:steroid 5-alpha reductase family enzyme
MPYSYMSYTLLHLLAFTVGINLLLYLFAYLLQTDKITDISYSGTFAIVAITTYLLSDRQGTDTVLLLLVLLWAIRLGAYLFYRIQQIGHDARFDDIRTNPWSFLGFWLMQGLTCGLVSFAFVLVFRADTPDFSFLFWVGTDIALAGWLIETIADTQKFRFKQAHPKQFMQSGLWRRIRHPNYLGELLFWWGIFLASVPYVNFWLALVSPVWISLILLRFSGIPILEKRWEDTYGDDPAFQQYQQRSWRLIPYLY